MENATPKRWKVRSEIIGIVEVVNAVLLTISGYSLGKGEGLVAGLIATLYVAGKNFVERSRPLNNYDDEK